MDTPSLEDAKHCKTANCQNRAELSASFSPDRSISCKRWAGGTWVINHWWSTEMGLTAAGQKKKRCELGVSASWLKPPGHVFFSPVSGSWWIAQGTLDQYIHIHSFSQAQDSNSSSWHSKFSERYEIFKEINPGSKCTGPKWIFHCQPLPREILHNLLPRTKPFARADQLCTEFGEVCRHHTAFKVAGDFTSASIGIRKSIATSTVTSGVPSPEAPHYTPFQCLFHVVAAALNWKLHQTTSRHHWRGRWQLLNPHVEQRGVLKYPSQTIREPK